MKQRAPRLWRTLYYIGPLVVWMGLIFFMSTDRGSADETRPLVHNLLARLFPGVVRYLTPAQIDRVDWNIRKGAHVTEYGILCILAYRTISFGNPKFRNRYVAFPLLLSILYAASDEYHQSFYSSRGAKAADVVFDAFGAFIGMTICQWQHSAKAQQRESSNPENE